MSDLLHEMAHINSIDIAWLEKGEGPLVLLLHGFPDTAYTFTHALDIIAEMGFHGIAPFQRGYYPSAFSSDGDYSIRSLAEDALALIGHFKEDEAVIVGHDWGASAAYAAAALRPDAVAKLVALAIPPFRVFDDSEDERMVRPHNLYLSNGQCSADFFSHDDFAEVDQLYELWSPRWKVPKSHLQTVKEALALEGRARAAVDYYRSPISPADRERFCRPISVPALLVYGSDEPDVRRKMFSRAQEAFETPVPIEVYSSVGHWPHLEAPDRFEDTLRRFLNG